MSVGVLLTQLGYGEIIEKRKQLGLELLKEKYHMPFILYGMQIKTFANPDIYIIYAYPVNDVNLKFKAEIFADSRYMNDEYIGKKVSCDIEMQMKKKIACYISNFEIFVIAGDKYCNITNPDIEIQDYLIANPKGRFSVYLLADLDEIVNFSATRQYDMLVHIFDDIPDMSGSVKLYYSLNEDIQRAKEYKKNMTRIDYDFIEIVDKSKCIRSYFENNVLELKMEKFAIELDK